MFRRPYHQRIAHVLGALDGPLLREHHCFFGGGTAIALRHGEYRESVDIDFLVSNLAGYSNLRHMLTRHGSLVPIVRDSAIPLSQTRDLRVDQYGIRTVLQVFDQPIKFEIILEARIALDTPKASDDICGIATLTTLDMAASKLLANSDRWGDDGTFNRDVIDLAMMEPSLELLRRAVEKAETAYGPAIRADLASAIQRLQDRHGLLERCMQALAMDMPKASLWKHLRSLRRILR